jgi:hypothetical protein
LVIRAESTIGVGSPPSAIRSTVNPASTIMLTSSATGKWKAPSVAPRNDFGTIGDAVQAIQAGQVPDDVYPNACN